MKLILLINILLVWTGCSADRSSANLKIKTALSNEALQSYQHTILNGPSSLIDVLESDNKISLIDAEVRVLVVALNFAWEAISPEFNPDSKLYEQICGGGMIWACQAIIDSGDHIKAMYDGYVYGTELTLDDVRFHAKKLYEASIAE